MRVRTLYCLPLLSFLLGACAAIDGGRGAPPTGATAVLAVLETSDVHANVLGYDY